MAKKKMTEKDIQNYVESRSEEALKELIMNDEMLIENRAFREFFRGGFYAGMNVQMRIMSDIQKEMRKSV